MVIKKDNQEIIEELKNSVALLNQIVDTLTSASANLSYDEDQQKKERYLKVSLNKLLGRAIIISDDIYEMTCLLEEAE